MRTGMAKPGRSPRCNRKPNNMLMKVIVLPVCCAKAARLAFRTGIVALLQQRPYEARWTCAAFARFLSCMVCTKGVEFGRHCPVRKSQTHDARPPGGPGRSRYGAREHGDPCAHGIAGHNDSGGGEPSHLVGGQAAAADAYDRDGEAPGSRRARPPQ